MGQFLWLVFIGNSDNVIACISIESQINSMCCRRGSQPWSVGAHGQWLIPNRIRVCFCATANTICESRNNNDKKSPSNNSWPNTLIGICVSIRFALAFRGKRVVALCVRARKHTTNGIQSIVESIATHFEVALRAFASLCPSESTGKQPLPTTLRWLISLVSILHHFHSMLFLSRIHFLAPARNQRE